MFRRAASRFKPCLGERVEVVGIGALLVHELERGALALVEHGRLVRVKVWLWLGLGLRLGCG